MKRYVIKPSKPLFHEWIDAVAPIGARIDAMFIVNGEEDSEMTADELNAWYLQSEAEFQAARDLLEQRIKAAQAVRDKTVKYIQATNK